MLDPLILDPAPAQLWHAFQREPLLPAAAEPLLARWRRSLQLGASGEGPAPEQALERGAALRARQGELEPLLACGQRVLERTAAAAARHDFTLLLADADGVVVEALGGGAFAHEARRVRLIAGAHWSERMRGTNAIGTALAEDRPVFVRGRAHYARSYHDLVCYAAPVRGPDGSIVAVLDATSVFARDDRSMGFGVVAAAHALEEVLRARAYGRAGAQVARTLWRTLDHLDTAAVLVEPPDRVVRANAAARSLLGSVGAHADLPTLLGLDFAALLRLAGRTPLALRLPGQPRDVLLRVDPIESDDACIAALVLLEPRATVRPPVAARRTDATPAPPAAAFAPLFAEDPALLRSLLLAERVAASELPIMLLAETGAGKELVAQGIHRLSGRGEAPFVAVNCGAIQPTLLESELFGYGPGAFTGAERRGHDGYLAAAAGGTLFLDEVAEMPLAMQAALLRVLETRTFRRVGETGLRRADCRVVCATCRDLPAMVAAGSFRRDLYFRLRGATVTLPPLRERSDVLPLARHLLAALAAERREARRPQLTAGAEALLARHPWPGNVRELKTALEVALVLAADDGRITARHLAPDEPSAPALPKSRTRGALAAAEGVALQQALAEAGGNLSRTAARLGVARSTLYRMLKRHGLGAEAQG